nr:MAG TPA: hypothetical protein [Caudoviricetes sp.]
MDIPELCKTILCNYIVYSANLHLYTTLYINRAICNNYTNVYVQSKSTFSI